MHHIPRSLRALGVLTAAVATAAALWLAASPPATSTVAPGTAGQSRTAHP